MSRLGAAARAARGEGITAVIEQLHDSERGLARDLRELADAQKVEHEVFYVARDIARWSDEHVVRLARAGAERGLELDPRPDERSGLASALRQKGAELTGRRHAPGLLLLAGLRHVHQVAAGVSLDWEVLAQSAQAAQDEDLLGLAADCHPETLRQLRWANAKVKESSAQIIVAG